MTEMILPPQTPPTPEGDRALELERTLEQLRRSTAGEDPMSRAQRLLLLACLSPWRRDLATWFDACTDLEDPTGNWLFSVQKLVPDHAGLRDLEDEASLSGTHHNLFAIPLALGLDVPDLETFLATRTGDRAALVARFGPMIEAMADRTEERIGVALDRSAACFLAAARCLPADPLEGDDEERTLVRTLHSLGCLALIQPVTAAALDALETDRLIDLLDRAQRPTPYDGAAIENLERRLEGVDAALRERVATGLEDHRASLHVVLEMLRRQPDPAAVDLLLATLLEHKRCDFGGLAHDGLVALGPVAARRLAERFAEIHDDLPDAVSLLDGLAHPSLIGPVRAVFEATGRLGLGEVLERLYQLEGADERPGDELAGRLEAIRREAPETLLRMADLGHPRLPERIRLHLVCRSCGRGFVHDVERLYVGNPMTGEMLDDFFYPDDVACPRCRKIGGHPIDTSHMDRFNRHFELLSRLDQAGVDLDRLPFRFVNVRDDDDPGAGEQPDRSILAELWEQRARFARPDAPPLVGLQLALLLSAIGERTRAGAVVDRVLTAHRLDPALLRVAADLLRRLGRTDDAAALERTMPRPAGDDRPARKKQAHRDVGRNDPCPCGSGKKYKKCCL